MNKAPASRFIKSARWVFATVIILLIIAAFWVLNLPVSDIPDAGLVTGFYFIAIIFIVLILAFIWGLFEFLERRKLKQPHQSKIISPQEKRKNIKTGWLIISIGILILGIIWFSTRSSRGIKVNSFASCVAAGNPVTESFPEQCTAKGQTFTNPDQTN